MTRSSHKINLPVCYWSFNVPQLVSDIGPLLLYLDFPSGGMRGPATIYTVGAVLEH